MSGRMRYGPRFRQRGVESIGFDPRIHMPSMPPFGFKIRQLSKQERIFVIARTMGAKRNKERGISVVGRIVKDDRRRADIEDRIEARVRYMLEMLETSLHELAEVPPAKSKISQMNLLVAMKKLCEVVKPPIVLDRFK